MKKLFLALLVAGIAGAGLGGYAYHALHSRWAGFREPVLLVIDRGASTRQIARQLRERGVIKHEWAFLLGRALRRSAVLQAGEYRFSRPASVWELIDRMARGDVFYHALLVPEGSNIFETVRIIASLPWIDPAEVRAVVMKPDLIADLDPDATNLEGYLFPSTYFVTRGASARQICRMMTGEFRKVWTTIGDGENVHETVTLASLIEKETGRAGERKLISSVFHNRLRRGMRLECDPTVIYAAILENRYDGVIRKSHLASLNRYNTYQHAGLPPGPIASPGRASLEAAIHPAQTDFLYFVARGDQSGGHVFSENLRAHNRAVEGYRRAIRQAKREGATRRVPAEPGSGTDH